MAILETYAAARRLWLVPPPSQEARREQDELRRQEEEVLLAKQRERHAQELWEAGEREQVARRPVALCGAGIDKSNAPRPRV